MELSDVKTPLHWHEIAQGAARSMPFAPFFKLDPSENPTVRPGRASPVERVVGEEGLVIVARRRAPVPPDLTTRRR